MKITIDTDKVPSKSTRKDIVADLEARFCDFFDACIDGCPMWPGDLISPRERCHGQIPLEKWNELPFVKIEGGE